MAALVFEPGETLGTSRDVHRDTTVTWQSGHSPFLSRPEELVELILERL
ncbi:hypothetical protein [Amycolatopsis sp. NPDC051071]